MMINDVAGAWPQELVYANVLHPALAIQVRLNRDLDRAGLAWWAATG